MSATSKTATGRPGRAGFTLVEIMIAMAILMIFGLMAGYTLNSGVSLWRSSHRRSYAYDTAAVIFQQMEDDLGAAKSQFWSTDADAYDKRIKFWVDTDGDEHQRLRFVRALPDETTNPNLRAAGTVAGASEYYNLKDDDGVGGVDDNLKALGGLCEVGYMIGLGNDDATTLYRAVLSPIGETAETLFDDAHLDTATKVATKALPLAENILYFELRCWTQYTTTWDQVDFTVWDSSYEPTECGPTMWWDSDRTSAAPYFEMDWGTPSFPAHLPESNIEFVRDNVFPSAVMAVVVIEPPANLRAQNPLQLREEYGREDGDDPIQVIGTMPVYNPKWPFVLIDDEWIRIAGYDETAQELQVVPGGREQRNTLRTDHGKSTEVKFGFTFSRAFFNPGNRECWSY